MALAPARAIACVLAGLALACDRGPAPAPPEPLVAHPPDSSGRSGRSAAAERHAYVEGYEGPSRRELVASPEFVSQRLAFSRDRFAYLQAGEVVVRRLGDFVRLAHFPAPGARNLVAMPDEAFLVLDAEKVQRLSANELQAELLPRAPRLGLTTLLTLAEDANRFWLAYEGVSQLAVFELGQVTTGGVLLPTRSQPLPGFDRRALVLLRDGSVVFTSARGLARSLDNGALQELVLPELVGRVWRLLESARIDQVWAITDTHVNLVALRPEPRVLERTELTARVAAAASQGQLLALLSIESENSESRRLRVDVYRQATTQHYTLQVLDAAAASSDAGPAPPALLELALAPQAELLAIGGHRVSVHDWRRGRVLFEDGHR